MRLFLTFLTGLVFGTGIILSGMANPAKVLNFFDFAGTFDPSLLLVMGSALAVTFVGYRLVLRRPAPLMEPKFALPGNRTIDARLLGGSALFGVGWGLSGFCPGGMLPVVSTLDANVLIFLATMLVGMALAQAGTRFADSRTSRAPAG